jgi:ribosomal protein L17
LNKINAKNLQAVLERIYSQAKKENVRLTIHAQKEMVDEDITLDEVFEALLTSQILEN